ncbi:CaiB/BaiF CoA transferase family protein [Niveispirillum fermenti]|uniref:CaiB/BaiF CoA transferase family protein n=1 Tax=Niveispirillum fermenti TaxID=1233113 RepID=UPI003A877857
MTQMATGPQAGPLAGLRVIDCTHVIAGAWCSMILADLGADVVKVEGPQGDVARAPIGLHGYANYDYVNRNKRGLMLDLSQEAGRDALRRLLVTADVFVENYRPGAMDRMGLGYAAMSARNPGLVYCSVSGFGNRGPYRNRGGLDLVTQAMSGIMGFTGQPDGDPMPCALPISDLNAGSFAAIGVLAALRERDRSGHGQHVETNLLSSAFAYTVNNTGEYLMTGHLPRRTGGRGAYTAPYEAFPTQDGDIVIGAGTEALWQRTAAVLDDPVLATDPRFATTPSRLAHHATLRERMIAVLTTRPRAHWLARLGEAGVPVSPINSVAEAIDDPQLQELGAVVTVEGRRHIRTPIDFSRTPVSVTRDAPRLGQHAREVLSEAGFTADEIAALLAGREPTA